MRDIEFWSDPHVSEALTGLLEWLTDDHWDPRFRRFEGERSIAETQDTLFSFRPQGEAAVSCFSGGLDSFGGAAIDLEEQRDLELVLVGASGTTRARALQRELAGALSTHSSRVQPLFVMAHLVRAKGRRQDRQQRTRGMLFLSLAAATALVAGSRKCASMKTAWGPSTFRTAEGKSAPTCRDLHTRRRSCGCSD